MAASRGGRLNGHPKTFKFLWFEYTREGKECHPSHTQNHSGDRWWHYQHRNFEEAAKHFNLVDLLQGSLGPRTRLSGRDDDFGEAFHGDKAAQLLRDRCLRFQKNPPQTPWNGADVLSDKHF